jgi:hypothetical protein
MEWSQRAVGDDGEWVVDVVLRALGRDDAQERVLGEVARVLPSFGADRAPSATYSFDMSPPDGSIGVSCWVRANSAGQAADEVVRIVNEAATAVTGQRHPLWDLRLVPGTAVFGRAAEEQSQRSSVLLRRRGGWKRKRNR